MQEDTRRALVTVTPGLLAIIVAIVGLILFLGSCSLFCGYGDIAPVVSDASAMANVHAQEVEVGKTMDEVHVDWVKKNAQMWDSLYRLVTGTDDE
jgi:hypothetical protein